MSVKTGNDLFIVDNSDEDWKVLSYLAEWSEISSRFDIATGYFEIGSLLALDGKWQKLDQIRILMGDEVSKRTHRAFVEGTARVKSQLDDSIEREKLKNDFLTGVPSIVEAIASGKIKCRIYTKKKFHAKAYITHSKLAVVGSSALVGSSNFTYPGLTGNVELNVQLRREVEELQQWYEAHWNDAEDVSDELLKVIERQTRSYLPFEVYAKSLQAYFNNYEETAGDWERNQSRMYPVLDQYQRDGYGAMLKIGGKFNGAFLCDGVGLGKTFVGLMLIERLVIRLTARELGFARTSPRIAKELEGALRQSTRRGIACNERGTLSLVARKIDDYDRAFLKQHLLSCISSKWCDKAEVPLRFARTLGFARTGPKIEELVWNLMRALQRGEQVQAEGRGASTRYRRAPR